MPKATRAPRQRSNPVHPYPQTTGARITTAQTTKRKPTKAQTEAKAQGLQAAVDQAAEDQITETQAAEDGAAGVDTAEGDTAEGGTTKGQKVLLTDEEKKRNHVISEKNRREKLRSGFDRIAKSLPGFEDKARSETVILNEFFRVALKKSQYRDWLRQRIDGWVEDV